MSHTEIIADLERSVHRLAVALEPTTAELGITQAEAHVLARLRTRAHTVGELQRAFGHKPSTLTNVLDRLDLRGYIERRVHPHDRRSYIVGLTRSGIRTADVVIRALDDIERRIRRETSARDLEGVRAVAAALGRLADAGE